MAAATFMTDLIEIATQTIEAVGSIASAINSYQNIKIAEDYYELFKEQREFYYSTFQNQVEGPLAGEVDAIPYRDVNYIGAILPLFGDNTPFRYLGGSTFYSNTPGDAVSWRQRHGDMYGSVSTIAPTDDISSMASDMMLLAADWSNFLWRYEENYTESYNDRRWAKRMLMANIAIKQQAAVNTGLATSYGVYEQAMQDGQSQLNTVINGLARYAGYRNGLSDTTDRFFNATFVGNAAPPAMRVPDYNLTLPGAIA